MEAQPWKVKSCDGRYMFIWLLSAFAFAVFCPLYLLLGPGIAALLTLLLPVENCATASCLSRELNKDHLRIIVLHSLHIFF